jgi:hypothetical protein
MSVPSRDTEPPTTTGPFLFEAIGVTPHHMKSGKSMSIHSRRATQTDFAISDRLFAGGSKNRERGKDYWHF